jgi:hypothetical protein
MHVQASLSVFLKQLAPYNLAGSDLTTHNSNLLLGDRRRLIYQSLVIFTMHSYYLDLWTRLKCVLLNPMHRSFVAQRSLKVQFPHRQCVGMYVWWM